MNLRRGVGVGAVVLAVAAAMAAPPVGASAGSAPAAEGDEYGRMMLLLDSSGSMKEPAGGGQTKIQVARKALQSVIGDLPEEAEVGLRVFGAEVFSRNDPGACEDSQLVVEPGTGNRDELAGAVGDYKPYGETPIPHALREAAKDLGDEGARSIVLVSDGESTCDPDPCKVAGELAGVGIDLQVDVVGLGVNDQVRSQLECIADAGNGTYYDADDAQDISDALQRVATRALRPFTLSGTPIEGGSEGDPTPITVGDWTDTLGPSGSRHFAFERTTEGSTLRVSAISQLEQGLLEDLTLDVYGPDGERCSRSYRGRTYDTRLVVGPGAHAAPDNQCGEAGVHRISVSRDGGDEAVPIGLRVSEEPPIEDIGFESSGDVDVTPPELSGKPTEVVGGASFVNASEIEEGRWSSSVVPGEAMLFRFPLEFGQAARVRVRFDAGTSAMRNAFGSSGPTSAIVLYNPMRGQLNPPDGARISEADTGRAQSVDLVTATPPIGRGLLGDEMSLIPNDRSMAGSYTLAVSLAHHRASVPVPFTIDLEIDGEPQDGPTYADGATWSVAAGAADDEPAESEEPGESPSADDETGDADGEAGDADGDSGSGAALTVGVLAGVGGLGALAGAVVIWRRRVGS